MDRSDTGFTLTEVLVAMGVVAILAHAVTPLFLGSAVAAGRAQTASSLAALAAQKMEQLRSVPWTAAPDGSTDLSVDPPSRQGRGLQASPADSLEVSQPGYVDYLDRAGQWIGNGAVPPPDAQYLRRWSVQPLGPEPVEAIVMAVLVRTLATADRRASPASAIARPDDVVLVDVLTPKDR